MLPRFYRIICVNNTGETVTFNNNGRLNVKMTAWKWNTTDGDITYTVLADDAMGFVAASATADGAEDKTSEIDNTTNEFVGLQVQFELTHDEGTAAAGTYDLYLDGGDATGELASDASGYDDAETNKLAFFGSLTWHPAGADDQVMRSSVLNI